MSSKLSGARKFEVRVFDHAQNVAERMENGGDTNPVADVLNVCAFSCAYPEQTFQCRVDIGDTPVDDDTARACG